LERLDIVKETLGVTGAVVVGVIAGAGGVTASASADDNVLGFRLKANLVFPAVDERNSSSDFSNAFSCFPIPLPHMSRLDTGHVPVHIVFDHSLEVFRWLRSNAC